MAAVKHDHVVTIYQVDEEHGNPFLAMEFLQGEPLDERLKRDGKMPVPEVLRIGREIAEGLDAAHSTGLIHRDIKPANIWLEAPKGRVKILDFGLARAATAEVSPTRQAIDLGKAASQDAALTQQGTIMGTPAYMAPEQALGEAVDARSDLFSLGCVLYRMCTGYQAFKGKDLEASVIAVARHQPIPPRQMNHEVPQELSDLVMRLLEKAPERRPASAAEVVGILEMLERKTALATAGAAIPTANPWEDIALSDPVPPPMETPASGANRSRLPLLIALGVLALVPLVWWLAAMISRPHRAAEAQVEKNGTLVVQIDPEVEARFKNGKVVLTGPDDKVRYTLSPGERDKKIEPGQYKVRLEGADGVILDTTDFTLKKGGKVTVRVMAAKPRDTVRAGPDLTRAKRFYEDTFANPASGWPIGRNESSKRGYVDGKYQIELFGRAWSMWNCPLVRPSNFACEVVGRVVGNAGDTWGLGVGAEDQGKWHGIVVKVGDQGTIEVVPSTWNSFRSRPALPSWVTAPKFGPLEHKAIKRGPKWNTLLVVVRDRRVEIQVNGTAVLAPFVVDQPISPAILSLAGESVNKDALAEFKRFTVFSLEGVPETPVGAR
jgi:hypothetical protein